MSKKVIGAETIQSRIKKNQNRASFVGITYWLATLVLTVLSVFPYVGQFTGYGADGRVWIVSCFEPILALTSGTLTGKIVLHAIVSIVYLLTFVFNVWNFIIASCKLFRITKKNPTNRHGYNRSSFAMRAMSKRYARSFFWTVTSAVAILLLGDGSFTLFFYIALVAGLFFHFLGNLLGCKVSYFKTTDDKFQPEEVKRGINRKIFALRNVVQFVAIALIVILMDRFGLIVGTLFNLVETDAMASIMANNLLDGLVLPVVLFLILVCLVVCIRHATGVTEYNSRGMKGKGMNTCRICATIIAVLALAGAIVVLLVPEGTIVPKWAFLGIFAIALLWVISEYMVVTLVLGEEKKELTEKEQKKLAKKSEKKEKKAEKRKAKAEKKRKTNKDDYAYDYDEKDEDGEEVEEVEQDEKPVEETSENAEKNAEGEVDDTIVEESEDKGVSEETKGESLDELLDSLDEVLDETEGVKKPQEQVSEDSDAVVETEPTEVQETTEGAEEFEEPVSSEETEEVPVAVEEEPYDDGLSETERKYRNELKQKWIDMASAEFDEPYYDDEDREQDKTVNCPCCHRKLRVKFGTDVAKCPACQNMFVLKIVKSSEEVFPQNFEGTEVPKENGYTVKDAEECDEFTGNDFNYGGNEDYAFDNEGFEDQGFDGNALEEPFEYGGNEELFKKRYSIYDEEKELHEQYVKEAEEELHKLLYGDDSETEE